jgi:hypothetical protein
VRKAAKKKPTRKAGKPRSKTALAPAPRHGGARLPLGAHPGNTGGKPGRSGRKPDEFKELLAGIRDEAGLPLLEEILSGAITYKLNGECSHCGKISTGPDYESVKVPSADVRARVLDMTMRYTVGLEKTIKLEGVAGTQAAYETIKARIRATLAPDAAVSLIDAITTDLKELRV